MSEFSSRTELLLGKEGRDRLAAASVIVFGAGGVGSYVIEALARAGIGRIAVVDGDTVSRSNINRQLFALNSTIGRYKAELAAERIADINPDCRAESYPVFYTAEESGGIELSRYDYIVDAVDMVSAKLQLAREAVRLSVPIISSMGTGNKLDPTRFRVTDISKTHTCPLAKVMRYELRRCGINHLKVLFSDEPPIKPAAAGRTPPGSVSFVPPAAGLIIAGEVIREIAAPDRFTR